MFCFFAGCADWGEYKKPVKEIPVYETVETTGPTKGHVNISDRCRLSKNMFIGKVDAFYKIVCNNGLSGYILVVDEKYFISEAQSVSSRLSSVNIGQSQEKFIS